MDLFGVRLVVGKEGRQDYSQLSVLSSRWILLNGEKQERNSLEFKKKIKSSRLLALNLRFYRHVK